MTVALESAQGSQLPSRGNRADGDPCADSSALVFTCSNCALTFAEPFCEMCGASLIPKSNGLTHKRANAGPGRQQTGV